MAHYKGRLIEILLEAYQNATARLYCPVEAIPKPGQYLQIWSPQDELNVVPNSAFIAGKAKIEGQEATFPIDAKLPETWQPGTELHIRGPLGRGFTLPRRAKRVVLAALAGNPGPLLPLAAQAIDQTAQVVFCTNDAVAELPLEVEVRGIDALGELLAWADYIAVDVKIEDVGEQAKIIEYRLPRSVVGEALIASPMPCGGLAKCGVCAFATRSGQILVCEDGPVVSLAELLA